MNWLVVSALVVCILVPVAHSATGTVAWCYHLPTCNYTTWPNISAPFCNGTRQSPININTSAVTTNPNLTAFTFTNYDNTSVLTKIENTGRTVKVTIASGVTVSGGDLPETYDTLQFHLHWGNGTTANGSEHTVDGRRYPMELHILNSKSSFNRNTTQAIANSEHTVDGRRYPMELHILNSKSSFNRNTTLAIANSTGLAAFGFFIEVMAGDETESPQSWRNLTSYLANITQSGQSVNISHPISLNSLLVGVDFTRYYRYLGSLTTPTCNEAVIWTVFKNPIKVSADLINLFGKTVRIGNSTSPFATNVYRGVQPSLPVQTSGGVKTSYSLGLVALSLALGRS